MMSFIFLVHWFLFRVGRFYCVFRLLRLFFYFLKLGFQVDDVWDECDFNAASSRLFAPPFRLSWVELDLLLLAVEETDVVARLCQNPTPPVVVLQKLVALVSHALGFAGAEQEKFRSPPVTMRSQTTRVIRKQVKQRFYKCLTQPWFLWKFEFLSRIFQKFDFEGVEKVFKQQK